MKHIIESQQFDCDFLGQLFTRAEALAQNPQLICTHKILASLFYEPSTRTRFSFESAMMRLGGNVITTENAKEFSSAAKGESIEDTIRVVGAYADVIVLRHYEMGMAARAAAVAAVPIINAGDGPGQHPTQALLDLYTIQRKRNHIDGTHVVMMGDLLHGRTVRSLCYLLGKYKDVRVTFVSLPHLQIADDIKEYFKKHRVQFHETDDVSSVLAEADVLYQTRIQKERFNSMEAYEQSRGGYIITRAHTEVMKKDAIIMHPLPRLDEIQSEVDTSIHAAYFDQARYGVEVRMALLEYVLNT